MKKGRTYTLSPHVYRRLGQATNYVRQAGFEPVQQEEMIRRFVRDHGSIGRQDVVELCRLSSDQAKRLLGRLVDDEVLSKVGSGKKTRYERGPKL